MYQKPRNKRNNKNRKSPNNNILKKDKIMGILTLVFILLAAFLLYYFVLKGNIKH